MKHFPIILISLLIVLSVFGVYQISTAYTDAHKAAWTVEASAKAVLDVQDYGDQLRNDAQRRAWFTEFYRVLFTGLSVAAAAGMAAYYWKVIDERQESKARMVDGSYALQTFTNNRGQMWTVDPNRQTFGAIGFDKSSGQLITDASMIGPDRQLDYVKAIQRTRTAQAQPISEIRNSAQAKYASGFYDRPQKPVNYDFNDYDQIANELIAPVEPYQPLSLADAFAQSKKNGWLIGQNEFGPCTFDVSQVVHTGLLGATKTGKTSSTALLMALNARKQNMHVIALDGADGVDWAPYSHLFEVHETDYTLIGDQLHEVAVIHGRRMKEIKLHGAPNVDELDYTLPSIFVILEEFGRTMQAFKSANAGQYELIVSELSNLMRVSRKTGIYFLLIDQSMNKWDQRFKPNVKDYIAYHLGAKQGAAFDAYELHKLKPAGQFWNNGQVYDSWFTKAEIKTLQQTLQPRKAKLLTDAQHVDQSTSIIDREVSEGNFRPLDTPIQSTGTQQNNVDTLVNDTSTRKQSTSINNLSTDTQKPALTGKPITRKDKELVKNVYALEGSVNKTCMVVYGGMSPTRKAWINEVLKESEVLQ